jgi:hypothetical protein
MPIHLTVDHEARLMTAVAEGDISKQEFEEFLDTTVQENTGGYRKLFDGRFASTHMSAEDVFSFGIRMKARHGIERTGPLAVVMTGKYYDLVARVLGMLATAERPMCIFEELESAQKWLESNVVREWGRHETA